LKSLAVKVFNRRRGHGIALSLEKLLAILLLNLCELRLSIAMLVNQAKRISARLNAPCIFGSPIGSGLCGGITFLLQCICFSRTARIAAQPFNLTVVSSVGEQFIGFKSLPACAKLERCSCVADRIDGIATAKLLRLIKCPQPRGCGLLLGVGKSRL